MSAVLRALLEEGYEGEQASEGLLPRLRRRIRFEGGQQSTDTIGGGYGRVQDGMALE